MLVGEVIQRIQSLYSKGVHSDDSRLKDRHIYNKVLTIRSKLIKQKLDKRQKLSDWNYQVLPCVELIKAPIHECPCIPVDGCCIYRSKYKIPEVIVTKNGHLIKSVTSLDGNTIFDPISWVEKKFKNGNKYTAKKPDYFIRNGYLYVTAVNYIEVITIEAMFKDPVEATEFVGLCDTGSPSDLVCIAAKDVEFSLDDDLMDTLIEMSFNELIQIFSQMREDRDNNNADSLEQNTK